MKKLILWFIFLFSSLFSYAQPTADFTFQESEWMSDYEYIFSDNSVCNGCTIVNWSWNWGDSSAVTTTQNAWHEFLVVGYITVTLTITDDVGNTDEVSKQVFNKGDFDVLLGAYGELNCFENNCITLDALGVGANPPYSYTWFDGETATAAYNVSVSHEVCTPGDYYVIATDQSGFQAGIFTTVENSFYVDINTSPEICGNAEGAINVNVATFDSSTTFLWSPGGETTSSISNLSAGNYSVLITGDIGCSSNYPITIHDSCGYISGNVFWDMNNNNQLDNNEPPFTAGHINTTGNSVYEIQISSNGFYSIWVGQGNYTTNFIPDLSYYAVNPQYHLSQINNTNDLVNFTVTPIPGNPDLQIFLFPGTPARPGSDASYQLIAKNIGTDTLSGYLRFVLDNRVDFLSASPTADSFINDTLHWNFTDLTPLETLTFEIIVSVPAPPVVNMGDILSFSAVIYPVEGDMIPLDNYASLRQTVVASYDPNDKWANHDTISPAQVSLGEFINYRIRFQNTGTDTAFNISVRNTLDINLDWNSLQMIYSSHDYTLSKRGGNALEWKFENILLPDSNVNEPLSHGVIFYRIKPKSTLVVDDSITNTAAIYFDFNEPVITNYANIVVAITGSMLGNNIDNINIFPNPATNEITINGYTPAYMRLCNTLGQTIIEANNTNRLFIGILQNGLYFLQLFDEKGALVKTEKIIKEN